jgi:hypothetical protein
MLKKMTVIMAVSLLSLSIAHGGMDEHNHDGKMMHDADEHSDHTSHKGHDMGKMLLEKKTIDGYQVTFSVMKAKPGMEMGGSHDFMIMIEKDGKAITNAVMNTKVIQPNKNSESKMTMMMGDWYMAGYDLGHEGEHQLMILFKTADGSKHKGGIYYPGK